MHSTSVSLCCFSMCSLPSSAPSLAGTPYHHFFSYWDHSLLKLRHATLKETLGMMPCPLHLYKIRSSRHVLVKKIRMCPQHTNSWPRNKYLCIFLFCFESRHCTSGMIAHNKFHLGTINLILFISYCTKY